MKHFIAIFYQLFNTVKKFNGIKSLLWLTTMHITYYITRLMRILNY
jgi:hypothetical protein